jgi:antitoxin PrlF
MDKMEEYGCCSIEAIVTVDSKGQIVLPKTLREKAGFKPEERIALITFGSEDKVSCILMIKAERLGEAVAKAISLNP